MAGRSPPSLRIDEREIEFRFIRSSGPGGQNVNKVATAVQLRFDVPASSLPDDVKARLRALPGARLTSRGILLIEAHRHRDQDRNRQDALRRLAALLKKSAAAPRLRHPTSPTRRAIERRLQAKKQRASVKRTRRAGQEID